MAELSRAGLFSPFLTPFLTPLWREGGEVFVGMNGAEFVYQVGEVACFGEHLQFPTDAVWVARQLVCGYSYFMFGVRPLGHVVGSEISITFHVKEHRTIHGTKRVMPVHPVVVQQ